MDVRRPAAVLGSGAEAADALAAGHVLAHAQARGTARRAQHRVRRQVAVERVDDGGCSAALPARALEQVAQHNGRAVVAGSGVEGPAVHLAGQRAQHGDSRRRAQVDAQVPRAWGAAAAEQRRRVDRAILHVLAPAEALEHARASVNQRRQGALREALKTRAYRGRILRASRRRAALTCGLSRARCGPVIHKRRRSLPRRLKRATARRGRPHGLAHQRAARGCGSSLAARCSGRHVRRLDDSAEGTLVTEPRQGGDRRAARRHLCGRKGLERVRDVGLRRGEAARSASRRGGCEPRGSQ